MSDTDRLRAAASDPDAPWYGSDLVPLVADAADEIDRLRALVGQERHVYSCRNCGEVHEIECADNTNLRARLAVAERVIEDLATDAHGSRAARALAEWEALGKP